MRESESEAEYAVRNADGSLNELPEDVNLDTARLLVAGFKGSALVRRVDGEWVVIP